MNVCYHLLSMIWKSSLLSRVWSQTVSTGPRPGVPLHTASICVGQPQGHGTATLKRKGLRFYWICSIKSNILDRIRRKGWREGQKGAQGGAVSCEWQLRGCTWRDRDGESSKGISTDPVLGSPGARHHLPAHHWWSAAVTDSHYGKQQQKFHRISTGLNKQISVWVTSLPHVPTRSSTPN